MVWEVAFQCQRKEILTLVDFGCEDILDVVGRVGSKYVT